MAGMSQGADSPSDPTSSPFAPGQAPAVGNGVVLWAGPLALGLCLLLLQATVLRGTGLERRLLLEALTLVGVVVVIAVPAWRARRQWQRQLGAESARRRSSEELLVSREAFLKALIDCMDVEVVCVDAQGHSVLWNDAARRSHDLDAQTPDSELGAWAEQFSVRRADGTPLTTDQLPISRALRGERVVGEECVMSAAGVEHRLSINARPIMLPDGASAGALCTGTDVSALHAREQELQRSNADLAAVAHATSAVLSGRDPRRAVVDAALQITDAVTAMLFEPDPTDPSSLAATAQSGLALDQIRIPAAGGSRTAEAYATGRTQLVPDLGVASVHQAVVSQLRARNADGRALRSSVSIPVLWNGAPRAVLTVGLPEPISAEQARLLGLLELLAADAAIALAREEHATQLQELASTDPLTGLANRRTWDARIGTELARAARTGEPLTIVTLDLDHFKAYNDTYGHPAGDALLVAAARVWSVALRASDLIARVGGEEFAVLLPDCSSQEASHLAARFLSLVPDGQTCSAGIAQWYPGDSAADLFGQADYALYTAKDAGRNRYAHAPRPSTGTLVPAQAGRSAGNRAGKAAPGSTRGRCVHEPTGQQG